MMLGIAKKHMITPETLKAKMAAMNPDHKEIREKREKKELLRKRLIARVARAHMSPNRAERHFKKRGHGSLSSTPSVEDAERLLPSYWTLEMTIAWIEWRDLRDVLRHHSKSLPGFRIWVPNNNRYPKPSFPPDKNWGSKIKYRLQGYDLAKAMPTSFVRQYTRFNRQTDLLLSHKEALDNLRHFLEEGSIRSSAFNMETGDLHAFSSHEWSRIALEFNDDGAIIIRLGDKAFSGVEFAGGDVVTVWGDEKGGTDNEVVEQNDLPGPQPQRNTHPYYIWYSRHRIPNYQAIGRAVYHIWINNNETWRNISVKSRDSRIRDYLRANNLDHDVSPGTLRNFFKEHNDVWLGEY